jgi:dGTPase
MEAADDICYAIVDLEDAAEMEILNIIQIETVLKIGLSEVENADYSRIPLDNIAGRVSFLRAKVVDHLIKEAVAAFFTHEAEILSGTLSWTPKMGQVAKVEFCA